MAATRNPSFRPPFRAEHIGSLLRPPALKTARTRHHEGEMSDDALRAVEDAHILNAIRMQEDIGLQSISDGEFRRGTYFDHFPAAVSGYTEMESALRFRGADGAPMAYVTPVVTGPVRRERGIAMHEFAFLRDHTDRVAKITLPSPCSQHLLRWREGVSDRAYPDVEAYFADLATVYREELRDLAAMGARNVQFDDVSLPLLCDETQRQAFARRGYDPDAWAGRYIDLINRCVAGRPDGLTVGMHLCRGNNQGKWIGEGGYEHIAERMFADLDIDYLCLEYDSPRAGSFAPLRFVSADKVVVLGLLSSKTPAMEHPDDLKRRIDEAARHVDPDRLCLSPQCGFASTVPGNPVTPEIQRDKLRLVVDVARAIWGEDG